MSPARMSKLESGARLALEFNEKFNRHDVAGMALLISDDCVFESAAPPPDGAAYSGKDSIIRFWREFFRESPHAHFEIEEIFGMGLRCIMRWRYEWEDASGEKRHVRGVDIIQARDGLICEKLSYVKG